MKKSIITLYLIFICVTMFAQNIVINPSFEDKISCPTIGGSQMQYSVNWYAYRRSPDYFNSCISDPTGFSVPTNGFGYQLAATGNAYAGVFSYVGGSNAGDTVYREYLGGQLSNPLVIGQRYYVSLKVSTPNLSSINCHTNKIGILFSKIAYRDSISGNIDDNMTNRSPITNFAHIYTSAIITDTTNWVNVSGSFIADFAYKYIIIGNFFDNQHTSFIKTNTAPYCNSYYLVDDICVSTDSLTCNTVTAIDENKNISESISVFPNPTNGNATVTYTLPQGETKGEIIIYDIMGAEIKRIEITNGNNKIELDNSALQAGIYFYQLSTSKGLSGAKKMVVVK